MDPREQTEWSDAVDDPTGEPESTEAGGPGGEGTVAQRLDRVTRYASGGAQSHPPEPAADPHPQAPPAPGPEGHAPHQPEPVDEVPYEPAPVDEVPYEPAPAEEVPQGAQPFDDPLQHEPAPAEPAEAPAALADAHPQPAAAPPPPAPPQEPPAAKVEAHDVPLGQDLQPEAPAAGAPEPNAAPAEPPADSSAPALEDGERLTVGRGIRLVAKLCECAELLVEGHLEATARTRHLTVAQGGRFIGSAEVDSAEIHGHFEGNLTVANRLVISATGSVAGTTRYQEIVIEAGGQVMGNAQRLPEQPEAGTGAA